MYTNFCPMMGMYRAPVGMCWMMPIPPVEDEDVMQPEIRIYDNAEEEDEVKEYKIYIKETDDGSQQLQEDVGFRCMREDKEDGDQTGFGHAGMFQQQMAGQMLGDMMEIPEQMMGQIINPQEMLRRIETHHPDIIRTMTDAGISMPAAKQLILRLLQIAGMQSM